MKRASLALMAAGLAGWASLMPALAVPPTVTPSPGYDARLQEQREAQRMQADPISKPVAKRRGKKTHAH